MRPFHALWFSISAIALNCAIIITGLLLIGAGPFAVVPNIVRNTVNVNEIAPFNYINDSPKRVIVPNANIDLAIRDGKYDEANKEWTINNSDAFYATPTSLISNFRGHTLIYGHNIPSVFMSLHDLPDASSMTIITENGYRFEYELIETTVVEPNDTAQFNYSGFPAVTLQTCTGDWNEYRELFVFRFTKWSKV